MHTRGNSTNQVIPKPFPFITEYTECSDPATQVGRTATHRLPMGDAIPKVAIVCTVCHTIIECSREASDHWLQQAVPSRCLWPILLQLFDSSHNLLPIILLPEKGDMWESTDEAEAIAKVGLEGGHHNDARNHNIGVGSSRKAGDDPRPQTRVDNVLLYDFGHLLGHISIIS